MTKEDLERFRQGNSMLCRIKNLKRDITGIDDFIASMNDIEFADIRVIYKSDDRDNVVIDLTCLPQVLDVIKKFKEQAIEELQKQFDEL